MNEDEYSMDDDEYYPEFVELAANELKSTLQFKSSYKKSAQIMIAQISVKMLTDYDDKDMIGLCKAVLQTLECTGWSVVAVECIPILEEAAEISA
eukprot:scaffold787_cov285-Chaetoceros_neogracile.AAC.79